MEANWNNQTPEEKRKSLALLIKLSAAQNGRAESLIAYEWKTLIENCCYYLTDGPDAEIQLRKAVKVSIL